MPSAQISQVIDTEKKAAGIEQEARTKALHILDAAKSSASDKRQSINKSTDGIIENIWTDAQTQAEVINNDEAIAAASQISAIRIASANNKSKTIMAAVDLLSGRI